MNGITRGMQSPGLRPPLCLPHAPKNRSRDRSHALLLALGVALGVAVALAACSGSSSPRAHDTATPTLPQPTRITAAPGDTALCEVVSPTEFARISGEAANQVTPDATDDTLTGLREVDCLYEDTSDPSQVIGRGTINFEVAADAQSASRTFQTVRQSFASVTDVSGVGDAAFAGTPGGASSGTGLVTIQGRLLLYLSVGGDQASVIRVTKELAALVLRRVA